MKRRLTLMIAVFGLIASGAFIMAYLWMRDSVTRETYASIRTGMTEAEVIKILRKPCDESYDGVKIWNGRGGRIGLLIGTQGTVGYKEFDDYDNCVWLKMCHWLRIDPPMRAFQTPTSGPMIFPDR